MPGLAPPLVKMRMEKPDEGIEGGVTACLDRSYLIAPVGEREPLYDVIEWGRYHGRFKIMRA